MPSALDILGAIVNQQIEEFMKKWDLIDQILKEDNRASSDEVMSLIKSILDMHMEIGKWKP